MIIPPTHSKNKGIFVRYDSNASGLVLLSVFHDFNPDFCTVN